MTIVDDIVELLNGDRRRRRPLKNPFPRAYPETAPEDYVADVVRQRVESLIRLRYRIKHKIQPDFLSAARRQSQVREISLREIRDREAWLREHGAHSAFKHVTPEALEELIDWIQIPEDAWQEPPPGANVLRFYCANEMYDLIEWFSPRRPSKTIDGPFLLGSSLLYQFIAGVPKADMRRTCHRLWQQWRDVPRTPRRKGHTAAR